MLARLHRYAECFESALMPQAAVLCVRWYPRTGSIGDIRPPRVTVPAVEDQSGRETVCIDDCLRKVARGFLRQIVADAAFDGPVRIFAGESLSVGARVQMRRAIGVAFHG